MLYSWVRGSEGGRVTPSTVRHFDFVVSPGPRGQVERGLWKQNRSAHGVVAHFRFGLGLGEAASSLSSGVYLGVAVVSQRRRQASCNPFGRVRHTLPYPTRPSSILLVQLSVSQLFETNLSAISVRPLTWLVSRAVTVFLKCSSLHPPPPLPQALLPPALHYFSTFLSTFFS